VLDTCFEAILIDKRRYKDNSLIVKVLGNDGVLYSGIYFEGKSKLNLQFLNFYQVTCDISPGKDWIKFKEVNGIPGKSFTEFHPTLFDQYFVLSELCRLLLKEEDSGPEIFSFLEIESKYFFGNFSPDFHILFLAKLISIYGYLPNGPFEGIYFDLRECIFSSNLPLHQDFCGAELIIRVFEFVNGNSPFLVLPNAKDRYTVFLQLLHYLELQKGVKLSLKSIEILRELRD
jgi:hypothetical protein